MRTYTSVYSSSVCGDGTILRSIRLRPLHLVRSRTNRFPGPRTIGFLRSGAFCLLRSRVMRFFGLRAPASSRACGAALIFLGAALCPALFHADASAQVRVTGAAVELTEAPYTNPSWSPTGDLLAVSGPRYEGLYVVDPASGNVRHITAEAGAGFGYSWSPDGRALATRVSRFEGPRRYNAVKVFDVETMEERQLTEYRTSMPALPTWDTTGERVLLYAGAGLEVFDLSPSTASAVSAERPIVKGERGLLQADIEGRAVAVLDAFADEEVLNLVRSPDGSRVAFEVMGGNLFTMRVDGSNVTDLGSGNRPAWSPDGEWIVFMVTEDDGHQITSSELVAARADGSERSRLTTSVDRHEMNPTWSADGDRIAFDDAANPGIFVIEVEY